MKKQLMVIVLIFLAACHSRKESIVQSELSQATPVLTKQVPSAPIERKLIKDGSLEFKTEDWRKTKQQLRAICDSLGAYSTDETLMKLSDRVSYHQIIRIPASRFDDLVDGIEKLSGGLENKSIKVDDVTKEFIDIEVRIKNKKEMENRYREMLKYAKKVDEMLDIERYITDVRTDIERMEAGLKSMSDRIAYSSVDVTFYEPVVTDFGFASKFVHSLSNGWENLLVVLVGLANIWPFLILLTAIAYWMRRRAVFKAEEPGVIK
jgi:biopolymer transport protein ExbD